MKQQDSALQVLEHPNTENSDPVAAAEAAGVAQEVLPPPPVEEVLKGTADWDRLYHQLQGEIDTALKQPLQIKPDKKQSGVRIPINAGAYEDAIFCVAQEPDSPEGTVLKNVQIGYNVKGTFRPVGKIDYLVMNEHGQITEVGSRSKDTLEIFRDQIFGRDLTGSEVDKTCELNQRLIDALRANPECAEKLQDFLENKREYLPVWASEWGESAKLAYYSSRDFNVLAWAEREGISPEDLYRAGLVERTVTPTAVRYNNRKDDVVFLPFPDNEDRPVLWRMKVVKPKPGAPKYRSAPLDRSFRQPETVFRQLYQANLLKDVEGKTVVITEGEFKCLVATQLTNIPTVGITGITQITDEIIDALIAAKPEKIVVLLDRDPEGMALSRIDKLTDSERAAYLIARRLDRAGYENVVIGRLPDVFEGSKVGLDDLLLNVAAESVRNVYRDMLPEPLTTEHLERYINLQFHEHLLEAHKILLEVGEERSLGEILSNSQEIRDLIAFAKPDAAEPTIHELISFAKPEFQDHLLRNTERDTRAAYDDVISHGLPIQECERVGQVDPEFHDLFERRQAVKQVLRDYKRYVNRAAKFAPESLDFEEAASKLTRLTEMADLLDRGFRGYLAEHHQGARRITQPPMSLFTLFPVPQVHDSQNKYLTTSSGRNFAADDFMDHVLVFMCSPTDLPDEARLAATPGHEFPFSMENLTEVYHGQVSPSETLSHVYDRGRKLLEDDQRSISGEIPPLGMPYDSFVQCVFLGHLAEIYPPDQYTYETDLVLRRMHPSYSEEAAQVQVAIFRDGDKPLAFASLATWEHHPDSVESNRAAQEEARNRAAIRSFLRSPLLADQREKFERIGSLLHERHFDEKVEMTCARLAPVGISEAIIREQGAFFLDRYDWSYAVATLTQNNLLNQAIQSGLLVPDENGFARPRFQDPVVFFPERNSSGEHVGYTIIPLSHRDHTNGSLPPVPKLAHMLDSPRSLTAKFDTSERLFLEDALKEANGHTVLVASSETEALQLKSAVHASGASDITVVGIKEQTGLGGHALHQLKQCHAKRIIFLDQESTANTGRQRHARLAFDDAETRAAKLFDATSTESVSIETVSVKTPIAELFCNQTLSSATQNLDQLLEHAIPVDSALAHDEYIRAKQEFSKLLQEVEVSTGLTEHSGESLPPQPGAIQELLTYYYQSIQDVSDSADLPETLEEFLALRYDVDVASAMPALFESHSRTLYCHGRTSANYSGTAWDQHLERVAALTGLIDHFDSTPPLRSALESREPSKHSEKSNRSESDRLKEEIAFLARTHSAAVVDDAGGKVKLFGKTRFHHQFAVEINGEAFTGKAYAGTKNEARTLAARELYRTIERSSDTTAARLLTDARATLDEKTREENEAVKSNYKGTLFQLLSRLQNEFHTTDLGETTTESGDGKAFTTLYNITIDDKPYSGRGEGTSKKKSEHLAASRLLTMLNAAGIIEQLEHRAQEGKERVDTPPYSRLLENLQALSKANQISALKEDYSTTPSEDKDLWTCQLTLTINGKEFSESGTAGDKKTAKVAAAELLLAAIKVDELPEPPADYTPGGNITVEKDTGINPVGALHEKLDSLAADYGIDIEKPKEHWSEKEFLVTERFTLQSTVLLNGETLTVEASGPSKKECRREAARLLLKQVEERERLLPPPTELRKKKSESFIPKIDAKARTLKKEYPEQVSKITREIEVIENEETPFQASYIITIFGEEFTGRGLGRSRTRARNAAAEDLYNQLEELDIDRLQKSAASI